MMKRCKGKEKQTERILDEEPLDTRRQQVGEKEDSVLEWEDSNAEVDPEELAIAGVVGVVDTKRGTILSVDMGVVGVVETRGK